MSFYLSINGKRAVAARVHVPYVGKWIADVQLDSADPISAAPFGCVLQIGTTSFTGTYDPNNSGVFGLRRMFRIAGGAGRLDDGVSPMATHADNGVKLSTIFSKLAAITGEKIENVPARVLGVGLAVQKQPASSYLHQLIENWHVDYAGTVRCVPWAGGTVGGDVTLVSFDPQARIAILAALNPGDVPIGCVLGTAQRLDAPFTVRSLDVHVEEEKTRIYAWGQ